MQQAIGPPLLGPDGGTIQPDLWKLGTTTTFLSFDKLVIGEDRRR
jgi:hypothetical protein